MLCFTGQPSKAYGMPNIARSSDRLRGVGVKTPLAKLQWLVGRHVFSAHTVDAQPVQVEGGVDCLARGTESLDHLPLQLLLQPLSDNATSEVLRFSFANIGALYAGPSASMEFGVDNLMAAAMGRAMADAIDSIVADEAASNAIASLAVLVVLEMGGPSRVKFDLDKKGDIASLQKGLQPATFDERAEFPGELAALVQISSAYDSDGLSAAAVMMAAKMRHNGVDYATDTQALYIHALRNATCIVHAKDMHELMSAAASVRSCTKYDNPDSVATMLIEAEPGNEAILSTHFHTVSDRTVGRFDDGCDQVMMFGSPCIDYVQYSADILREAFANANNQFTDKQLSACKAFRVSATLVQTHHGRFIVFSGHFKYPVHTSDWGAQCAALLATWHKALQSLDSSATVIMGMDTNLQSLDDTHNAQQILDAQDLILFNTTADPPILMSTAKIVTIIAAVWVLPMLIAVLFL